MIFVVRINEVEEPAKLRLCSNCSALGQEEEAQALSVHKISNINQNLASLKSYDCFMNIYMLEEPKVNKETILDKIFEMWANKD